MRLATVGRASLCAVVGAGLMTVGMPAAGGAVAPGAPEYAQQTPRFGPCEDAALTEAGAQCATVRVPVDHTRPDGPTIDLAISRIRATDPSHRRGILLFNPGGPGGAGLDYPAQLRSVLGNVADQYDLIGFDPRFVGRSNPISCGPVTVADLTRSAGLDRSGFDESARVSADFARRCHERNAAILPFAGIRDVARDMDLIRASLGERRLSYYGVSWGADLGATYSELFGDHVDRMVIDSVSAVEAEYDLNRAGAGRAEAALDEWAAWTAGHDDEYHLGTTPAAVRAAVTRLVEQAARRPITIGGFTVDDNLLPFIIRNWLSHQSNDPALARALRDLVDAAAGRPVTPSSELTDTLGLFGAHDEFLERYLASSFAVFCADSRWPNRPQEYWQNIQRSRRTEPVFGPLGNNITPCAFWSDTSTEPPLHVANSVPMLIVQASRDNSPYPLAVDLHRRLTGSRLVTVDIRAHGLYDRRISDQTPIPCVEQAVNAYLGAGALPVADSTCPPPPERPVSTATGR